MAKKYCVTGKCGNEAVYWNKQSKGWYVNKCDATKFDDYTSALEERYRAETIITVEIVENIKIKVV